MYQLLRNCWLRSWEEVCQLQTHFSVLSYETKNKQWATDKKIDGVLDGAIPMSGRNPVGTVVFTFINTYTDNIYHHPTAVFATVNCMTMSPSIVASYMPFISY